MKMREQEFIENYLAPRHLDNKPFTVVDS